MMPPDRETLLITAGERDEEAYLFCGYYDRDSMRWYAIFPDDEGDELKRLVIPVLAWIPINQSMMRPV